MYLSTSTEYIMPRVHEYRVHLSTPKYVLEYMSTEYMSTSAPTLPDIHVCIGNNKVILNLNLNYSSVSRMGL